MSISRKRKFLTSSLFLLLVASCGLIAQPTYPPSPASAAGSEELLSAARNSFLEGDLPSAYKHLLLSEDLNGDREWRDLYFLTLVGLGHPADAAAFVLELKDPSAQESFRAGILLKRNAFASGTPQFKPAGKPLQISKEVAKKAVSIAEGKDSVFVLTPETLYTYNAGGGPPSFFTLTAGREVMPDEDGMPLVLTSDSIIRGSATVPLPLSIADAVSFARAPKNCLYVLDSAGKVFLMEESGRIIEERQILIRKPLKIRTDSLWRVFILSGGEKDISVYGAGFEPLFVLSPEAAGAPSGRLSDLQPDFAGNPMILDRSGKELILFNSSKSFLGRSSDRAFQADLFFWNGGERVLVLDRKKSAIVEAAI